MSLPPEIFALIAAASFAASQVTVRRGLVSSSIVSGVLVSLSAALLVISIPVLLDPPGSLNLPGVALFAVAGIAAPGISRWASTTGVRRLGPSISVPITQGARPLLAIGGAIVFLGESIGALRVVGVAAIVLGGWQLTRSRPETSRPAPGTPEGAVPDELPHARRLFRPGIAWPLIAGLAYATSDVVVKRALGELPYPSFGALVGMATALGIWILSAVIVRPLRDRLRLGPDKGWLALSGGFAGMALLSMFSALKSGEVTLVSPIIASQPLAVFLLSRALLGDLEKLHLSTVLAGTSVAAGTVLVSL